MARIHLAFLLDFFQPSHQPYSMVARITRECYRPLAELFNSHANARFTLSMANSLAALLEQYGESDVLEAIRRAVEHGGLELIHTAAYHPILPLLPDREVRRQIELDINLKARQFGETIRAGILSPEMSYDDRLLPLFKELGFRWTIVDDRVMEMNGVTVPDREVFLVSDFAVFMRSSFWSDRIRQTDGKGHHLTGRQFALLLNHEADTKDQDSYKIVALSAETFGHHINYYEETFLRDMLFALDECSAIHFCHVSELLKIESLRKVQRLPRADGPFTYFPPSSWATHPGDYERGDPYPHWRSKGNAIHEHLWTLTGLLLKSCERIDFENPANSELRSLLDRAFYSTQYFWASVWFWKPELIYEGIDRQMRALYKCAEITHSRRVLREGGQLYAELMWEIYKRSRAEGA